MDSNSPAGCHKVSPENQSGDVDKDGDIVGALFGQLPHARALRLESAKPADDLIADDVAWSAQLELVAGLLDGAR